MEYMTSLLTRIASSTFCMSTISTLLRAVCLVVDVPAVAANPKGESIDGDARPPEACIFRR